MNHYTTNSLFSICSRYPQVDGLFGLSAVLAELLIQSHEQELHLLPALPDSWTNGEVSGFCARGGFEVSLKWTNHQLESVTILSKLGQTIQVRYRENVVELETEPNRTYKLNNLLEKI